MGEKVATAGVEKEGGYLYYIDSEGNIARSEMARGKKGGGNREVVSKTNVKKEPGYLYYVDKDGDVARAKMKRGSSKKPKKISEKK